MSIHQATVVSGQLQLDEPLPLPDNSRVTITIVPAAQAASEQGSYGFLDTALNANLQGPQDWSRNLDEYLYGGKHLPQ
jgi:hypothetical protein